MEKDKELLRAIRDKLVAITSLIDNYISITTITNNNSSNTNSNNSRFFPTREDIQKECETKRYWRVDPGKFYTFYSAKGWKDKNGKQINWRTMLNWWNNNNNNNNNNK